MQAGHGFKYRGLGVDSFTFILELDPGFAYPGGSVMIYARGKLLSNGEPADPTILLVCFIGMGNCTKQSTGISSIGDHTITAIPSTPSAMHTTGAAGEVTSDGKHGHLETFYKYRNTLQIRHNQFRFVMVKLVV